MKEYIIQPQCGMRIEASKGQTITIIDVEGGQVADFFAGVKGTHGGISSPLCDNRLQ